jgi:hypothetical protein
MANKQGKNVDGGAWVRTLAEQVCRDCGKLGCLIPVTHKLPEQRTGDEPV